MPGFNKKKIHLTEEENFLYNLKKNLLIFPTSLHCTDKTRFKLKALLSFFQYKNLKEHVLSS